jgi:hypothetical protein
MKKADLLFAVIAIVLCRAPLAAQQTDAPIGPVSASPRFQVSAMQVDTPLRAIEYSDAYGTRLTIHRIGSFAMIPLFAAEYMLGDRLIEGDDVPGWVRSAHGAVAGGLGVVFASNTITGGWNLLESRHDPEGRTRRFIHSVIMLAGDASMVYAASVAEGAHEGGGDGANRHRAAALTSIGISTAGTVLMWLWKD